MSKIKESASKNPKIREGMAILKTEVKPANATKIVVHPPARIETVLILFICVFLAVF